MGLFTNYFQANVYEKLIISINHVQNKNYFMKTINQKFTNTIGILLFVLLISSFLFTTSCKQKLEEDNPGDTIKADLTFAPAVPRPITYRTPKHVDVNLEVIEKTMRIADGVEYNFWTLGGRVPGKFIRVRVGDDVTFHLSNNPNNKMPHNIDLHAVTGAGGGAASSLTAPGHTSTFSFKTLNAGLYVYHCATAPVGMHIANGMYGLILVEPEDGLPKVDKEFYIMQGDFYTKGKNGEQGLQAFDMDKALHEDPEYVLFNGSVGANAGDNALRVYTGETVRIFIGNGGPNLVSSFHVIGEIFDKVYIEGGENINKNVQTTLIPAGGSAIVEFKCEVPGKLNIVDHSIFRTFNKGALAQIIVMGDPTDETKKLYSGKQSDVVYLPEGGAVQDVGADVKKETIPERSIDERMKLGKMSYENICAACHQKDGNGVAASFPPLAKSDFLAARSDFGINILSNGLQGKVTVNGKTYDGIMPKLGLSDDEIANILTYVNNSFGNKKGLVTVADVKRNK